MVIEVPALAVIIVAMSIGRLVGSLAECTHVAHMKKAMKQRGRVHTMDASSDEECTICLEDLSCSKVMTLRCNHTFHQECIQRWFTSRLICPNCNATVL